MIGSKNKSTKINKNKPLVSIITPVYNGEDFIEGNLKSVANQTYPNIEHIIIDGKSKDKTLEIVEKHKREKGEVVSEKDKGIFDAMNKGIEIAEGQIIGILNSDDFYKSNRVIEKVVRGIQREDAKICWGDLIFVDPKNTQKIIRYWKSSPYQDGLLKEAWLPPHPSLFVKKEVYEKSGNYRMDFPYSEDCATDYEWRIRVLKKYKKQSCYIPDIFVVMRQGGNSTNLKHIIKHNIWSYKAWRDNNLKPPCLLFLKKVIRKVPQFFKRPEI